MKPPGQSAFTLVELLVIIAIIGVLLVLTLPSSGGGNLVKSDMTQTLSNTRQLMVATYQMALDGATTGDTNIGWPGDIGGTFTNWTHQLLTGYLTPKDLNKPLSAPEKNVPGDKPPVMTDSAILVYAVSTNSPDTTVLLTSANFTNTPNGGLPRITSSRPYGQKGFVVFRKGGDGSIYKQRQAGSSNIGTYAPLCR